MANDHIFIQCRHCKEQRSLAKYYPTLGHGVWFPEKVCNFIEKHMKCSPSFGDQTLNGDRCFDLITESDDAFVFKPKQGG